MQAGRRFGVSWEQDMVEWDSHTDRFIYIATYGEEFSTAGWRVDALNAVTPHMRTHTHSEPLTYPSHDHNRNACLVQRYVGLLQKGTPHS